MGQVEGRTAIVTGGASGIGAATARVLAREGAHVVITDVQDDKGEELAAAIKADDGHAVYRHHDVTDEAAWTEVIQYAETHMGRLSILFNNAGVRPQSFRLEDYPLDDWERHMQVNMTGVFLGLKYGIRAMKEQGGAIVCTSSIYGSLGAGKIGPYAASKGGVRTLCKAAAIECGEAGYDIRVNSVHPGFIHTPMLDSTIAEFGERVERRISGSVPLRRIGEPEDIANGVLYLVSDAAKYVTGIELNVDGGYSAQ